MYAIYKKTYSCRETELETNLELCQKGPIPQFLSIQKNKMGVQESDKPNYFCPISHFFFKCPSIRQIWLNKAAEVNHEKPEIDLHLHMISTIASADEVYKRQIGPYQHKDELWIWIPSTRQGITISIASFQDFKIASKIHRDIFQSNS